MVWQTLSSKVVYKSHYMTVKEDELVTDHGDHVTYGIIHKDPCVVVIPWDGHKTLLVGQYRFIVDYISWEFVMGHTEHGDVSQSAINELKEEAGMAAKDLTEIGRFFVANGTMDQECICYLTREWSSVPTQHEPSEKGMQSKWVSLPQINQMITDGIIKDGPTIASLKVFELYLFAQS